MYYYDSADPYGDPYYYDPYSGGTTDPNTGTGSGSTSSTRPGDPGGNGWWAFINGAWRWVTDPISRNISP